MEHGPKLMLSSICAFQTEFFGLFTNTIDSGGGLKSGCSVAKCQGEGTR